LFFGAPWTEFGSERFAGSSWAVSTNGSRALLLVPDAKAIDLDIQSSSRPAALRMITHWFTELNQQVPTGKQ